MRIKIQNPVLTRYHREIVWCGILSLLMLIGMGFAIYFAGGADAAWQALGNTINDICENDLFCKIGFSLLFKVFPFVILGFFILFIWEKRIKFPSPRRGTYFTHITFGPDGVLLEKPAPGKNVFLPYQETSFHLSADIRMAYTKYGYYPQIWELKFVFKHPKNPLNAETIQLLPPRKVYPFLCKILDKRQCFNQFSYDAAPSSHAEAAKAVLKKLDGYCETGFMSLFDTKETRNFMLCAGIIFAFGVIYALWSFGIKYYFKSWFFLLIPIAAWFLWLPLKDGYLERKTRNKHL